MIFGDRYLFLFGEFANYKIAFIDLEVATSEKEQERKETKLQLSSFNLPEGYRCEYHYEPSINASRTKLAFVTMSFTGDGSDFNGVVVLDISKSYEKEEDAFPTISAIMDKQDEEKQNVYAARLSKSDDDAAARVVYLSETRLKVCDVATKEIIFEVEVEESLAKHQACCCLFHPTNANLVLLTVARKAQFYDVKLKTQLREVDVAYSPSSQFCWVNFPTLVSESRYLVAYLYDKGRTAEEDKNFRLDVLDTDDGAVIQSTSLQPQDSGGFFLSYNTMLFGNGTNGAYVLSRIAISPWTSRKAVFLVREKSSSSTNRIVRVLQDEWLVMLLVTRYYA